MLIEASYVKSQQKRFQLLSFSRQCAASSRQCAASSRQCVASSKILFENLPPSSLVLRSRDNDDPEMWKLLFLEEKYVSHILFVPIAEVFHLSSRQRIATFKTCIRILEKIYFSDWRQATRTKLAARRQANSKIQVYLKYVYV